MRPAIRILQFNMCGAATGHACVSRGRSGDDSAVPAIVASILNTRDEAPRPGGPELVTLNEACRPQIDAIVRRLDRAGYPMQARFATARPDEPLCEDHSDFGNAILTRAPITNGRGDPIVFPLPRPDGAEVRTLLCVQTVLGRASIEACSVHLTNVAGKQADQAGEVARVVDGFDDDGMPVVLAGDFNATPADPALNPLYGLGGGTGRFREVDDTDSRYFSLDCRALARRECRSGEPSFGPVKIDYIFLSKRFTDVEGGVVATAGSDHEMLRGSAVLSN